MPHDDRDPLDDRASRFMHALADSGFTTYNVKGEKRGDEAFVRAELPGHSVNEAQSIASAHGFNLRGRLGDGREFGEYEFHTKRRGREMFDPDRGDDAGGLGGML